MPPKKSSASRAPARGMTKSQIKDAIAKECDCAKGVVSDVLDALAGLAIAEVKAGRAFTVPSLVKITRRHKAAVPARQGIDPFTKQPRMFKARPATNVVRSKPVKALKVGAA
jgi:nucleoid DNA-binding protein